MREYYRVQADISLDAIAHNLQEVKRVTTPGIKVMAIIKADGYGHGAIPIAKVLDDQIDAYGVAIVEEAINLRQAGITKPILVLGVVPEQEYDVMIEYNIMPAVFEYETAKKISLEAQKQNKQVHVHIKVDTGMGRIGLRDTVEGAEEVVKISQLPQIIMDGIFTHMACADEADKTSAQKQIKRYTAFVELLEQRQIKIPIHHVANSAGIIDMKEADFNMVRTGIMTYGLYPSEEVNKQEVVLQPAMSLKANVSFVKEVEAGVGISYNSTYVTKRKTKIATIPVGYADGYPRALSNVGRVLIHGVTAPIIGRVCMDQFMVDVTGIDVKEGDTATLIGIDGKEQITIEEMADMVEGSFSYELICDISKRIPRVYYYRGRKVGTLDYMLNENQAVELEL